MTHTVNTLFKAIRQGNGIAIYAERNSIAGNPNRIMGRELLRSG